MVLVLCVLCMLDGVLGITNHHLFNCIYQPGSVARKQAREFIGITAYKGF